MESNKDMENISHAEYPGEATNDNREKTVTQGNIEDEPAPHLHFKTYLIVVAVSFLSFAQLIQLVATGVFASTIATTVGSASLSSWLLASLTTTFIVLAPPVSQAADYWGRRWLLIILAMAGCVGTIITSRATSIAMAIVGEVFVGAAFAATPLQFAVASEVLPRRHRLAGQAGINAAGGTGSIFATLAGAKFLDVYGPEGFRYLFYINAGLFAIAALVCFVLYKPPVLELQTSLTTLEKLRRLDWPGYFIILFAVVLFCMGLSWANNPYPWNDAHVLAPFLIGIVLFIVLGVYCWRINKNSLIPRALFSRNRNLALSLFAIFCEGLIFASANVYFPTQVAVLYQDTWGVSLVFMDVLIVYVVISPVTAIICYKFKLLRSLIVLGFICFLAWGICMATTTLNSKNAIWGYAVLLGLGLPLVLNAVVAAAQLSAPVELISITSGLMAAIRSLGVTLALAIYTAIFNSRISNLLPSKISAAAVANGLPESSVPALILDLSTSQQDQLSSIPGISPGIISAAVLALQEAYLESFHSVWIAVCCLCSLGLIASCFLANPSKDLNNHIDHPAESEEALYRDN